MTTLFSTAILADLCYCCHPVLLLQYLPICENNHMRDVRWKPLFWEGQLVLITPCFFNSNTGRTVLLPSSWAAASVSSESWKRPTSKIWKTCCHIGGSARSANFGDAILSNSTLGRPVLLLLSCAAASETSSKTWKQLRSGIAHESCYSGRSKKPADSYCTTTAFQDINGHLTNFKMCLPAHASLQAIHLWWYHDTGSRY